MNKRRYLWIGIGVAVAALGVWIVGVRGGRKEPVYEGKALSFWLKEYVRTADPKTEDAVRKIGTNAIPTLLRMIRAKDPAPAVQKLLNLASKQKLIQIDPQAAYKSRYGAVFAFQVLGPDAASAVPELMKICADARHPELQEYAVQALGRIGSAARAALPILLSHFTHTNSEVSFNAVISVGMMGGDAKLVVPAMKNVLKGPSWANRFNAVAALHNYIRSDAYSRSNVLSAVPEMLEALRDQVVPPGRDLKDELEGALWDLVPEKIAKPLIVEDSTPMVTNGVTTETLYRREYGDLWALIPKGKTVRCTVYQSIANNPVYLYRGTNHFLGRFQVAEPATNTAVEIVYIIDEQQIRLCARDYGRKEFPALRRVEQEAEK